MTPKHPARVPPRAWPAVTVPPAPAFEPKSAWERKSPARGAFVVSKSRGASAVSKVPSARTQILASSLFLSSPKENRPVFNTLRTLCPAFSRSFANVQVLTQVFSSAYALFVKNTREGGTPKSMPPGIKRLTTHRAAIRQRRARLIPQRLEQIAVVVSPKPRLRRLQLVGEPLLAVRSASRRAAIHQVERKSPARGAFAVSQSVARQARLNIVAVIKSRTAISSGTMVWSTVFEASLPRDLDAVRFPVLGLSFLQPTQNTGVGCTCSPRKTMGLRELFASVVAPRSWRLRNGAFVIRNKIVWAHV